MPPHEATLLAIASAEAAAILALFLIQFRKGADSMSVPDDIRAQLARIDTSVAALPTKVADQVAAGVVAATAQATQDHADTLAAVTEAADKVAAAVGA